MSEKSSPAAWSGRFNEPVAELTQRYTASIPFDYRLAPFDIEGSLAHARMLEAVGVLSEAELVAITQGLSEIRAEIDAGRFEWRVADEDVHTHVEKALTAKIGEAGKKLHTARSRNDQVATDVRLYLRAAIDELGGLLRDAQAALVDLAERHADTLMPGFTHLQVAQPVTFGHHLMAYVEMLFRDAERLSDCRRRVNRSPLGAAALAGTGFPIDREMTARLLDFEAVCENSLDAVSDRDFAVEFCSAAALLMLHLSRFAEELVLWSSPRFGFIELADRHCTGSSIMPQKKNPDIPELIRGKSGRVTGHVMALMMLVKAQPLAYNKDNQEDKEPLFDTVDTLRDTLTVLADLVHGLKVHPAAMRRAAEEGYATATDLADYLVEKGVAFRDAHEIVARAVRHAAARGVDLAALPRDELRAFSPRIEDDVAAVLTLEGSVARRDHVGGTAPAQVRAAVARARARLG